MPANVFKVPVIGSFAALDLRGGNTLTSVRVCAGPSEFSKAALSQLQEVKRSKTSMPLGDNGGPLARASYQPAFLTSKMAARRHTSFAPPRDRIARPRCRPV